MEFNLENIAIVIYAFDEAEKSRKWVIEKDERFAAAYLEGFLDAYELVDEEPDFSMAKDIENKDSLANAFVQFTILLDFFDDCEINILSNN